MPPVWRGRDGGREGWREGGREGGREKTLSTRRDSKWCNVVSNFGRNYSLVQFDHVTASEALQRKTSVKGRAHTCSKGACTPDKSSVHEPCP